MDLEIHAVLKEPLFLGHGLQPCVNIFQDVRNDLKMVIYHQNGQNDNFLIIPSGKTN